MQFSNFNDITKLTNKFLLGEKKAYAVKLYANFYSKEIFLRIEMLKCNHGVLLFKMDSLVRLYLKYPLKSGLLSRKVGETIWEFKSCNQADIVGFCTPLH